jgi:transcriptional regulator with XRE-family HTH domain
MSNPFPAPVEQALVTLGQNLRKARLRRNISAQLLAERAMVSRSCLVAIEKGGPGVAIGNILKGAWVLGFLDEFTEIASIGNDPEASTNEEKSLRQRARRRT